MSGKATCRCCLTWSADKDLKARHKWLGETEVYADMLKECFEIHIDMGQKAAERGICFSCILRLRDAFNFKKQVLKCQREFRKQLQKGTTHVKDEKPPIVKQEIIDVDELVDADDSLQQNNSDSFFFDLKEEFGGQDDGEDDKNLALLAIEQLTKRHAFKKEITVKKIKGKSKKLEHNATIIGKTLNGSIQRIRMGELPSKQKLARHQHNIGNIIKYSNVTPFFSKTYTGFECAYCKESHKDLESLKSHNSTHADKIQNMIAYRNDLASLTVKLDITDLKCNICSQNLDLISNLKKHLMRKHDIKFYADVKDYIMEFKLSDNGKFDCALCNSPFETFKMLLQHMNRHYRNYMCDNCGSGFINMTKLVIHKKTHMTGEFKCSYCDKVFNTNVKKNYHEKYIHNPSSARYVTKCLLCNENFSNYYQRNSHMVKEHKTAAANYKCNVCDKKFLMKSKLTKHIKKDHLLEKNHSCDECGMQFHSKQCLRDHMVKHNGEKIHKCTVCSKAYARKKTLREHMRIHLNDRRFKCGVCELAFVQKCSLKGHMLSNHGLSLSEYESAAQFEQKSASGISE